MSKPDYSNTIIVSATSDAAYRALTEGFEHWWTQPDKRIKKVGDRARFAFPPGLSYWTFEATRLSPNSIVEMICVDALHIHEGKPREIEQEWLDTTVKWQIKTQGEYTQIHIEHVGLTPDLLCYDICQAGWDHFFLNSLAAYLNTGKGTPHQAN